MTLSVGLAASRWLCGLLLALMASGVLAEPAKCIDPAQLPELTVQLKIEKGRLAVDRSGSKLDLKGFDAKFPGWTEPQLGAELLDFVDRTLAAQGTLLRQFVLSADGESVAVAPERMAEIDDRIAQLGVDPATAKLLERSSPWTDPEIHQAYQDWRAALKQPSTPWAQPGGALSAVWQRVGKLAFGDGPLMSTDSGDAASSQERQMRQRRQTLGILSFVVSPPFVSKDGDKLRPTVNAAQWDALRAGFGDDVLKDFDGKLWRRADMLRRAMDYMALRGVELRVWRSEREQDVACKLVDPQDEPQGYPGIVPMRPRANQSTGSGRILVSSDPLPAAVYVVGGPDELKLALRALYLLLPSADFSQVRADPMRYLRQVREGWLLSPSGEQPDTWHLALDHGPGRELRFSEMLMTRSALAERLQRLALLSYQARIAEVKDITVQGAPPRRQGALVLEPIADAEATAEKAEPALDATSELSDVAAPKPLKEAPRVPSRKRHHLRLGVEQRAGQPAKAFGSFRRDGISNEDTVAVEFGHNGALQGAAAYERDFVAFDRIGRRLQLSARVYSDFTPDRVVSTVRTDLRRKGAQASSTLDLWRDWSDSFGQAEVTLSREHAQAAAAGGVAAAAASDSLSRVLATLTVARSQPGTAASMHDEAVFSTLLGKADTGSFHGASVALHHHRFVGFFDRVDIRFFARGVSHRAPATELPTFGGEDSVRGLREGQATGRRVWALQSEWWMPIPWKTDNERLASLFRRQIALAAWIDTGAIHGPTTPIARQQTAAGFGLRYTQSDELTMRLDLARPIAGLESEQRRLRLLLTVTMRPRL